MLFAELTGLETAGIICSIVAGVLGSASGVIMLFKRQEVQVQQPVDVQLVKALHDQFAAKEDFDRLVEHNAMTHRDLFLKINGVERGARERLEEKLDAMQRSSEEARVRLHQRLNTVLEAVSELRGTVNQMSARRADGVWSPVRRMGREAGSNEDGGLTPRP